MDLEDLDSDDAAAIPPRQPSPAQEPTLGLLVTALDTSDRPQHHLYRPGIDGGYSQLHRSQVPCVGRVPPASSLCTGVRGGAGHSPEGGDARRTSPWSNPKATHHRTRLAAPCRPLADTRLHQTTMRRAAVNASTDAHTPSPKGGCDGY